MVRGSRQLALALVALVAVVALVLVAKRPPKLRPAPSASARPPPPPPPELPSPFGAWLDCSAFAPAAPAACPPADDAEAELVRAASGFMVSGLRCVLMPPFQHVYVAAAEHALHRMAAVDVTKLPQRERIVAQNAALRLAICAGEGGAAVQGPATSLVRKLALPASVLDALGDAPDPAVERWIGARDAWTELLPLRVPVHSTGLGDTRVSRPVRARAAWANIQQLVAIDTRGRPHVTPLVGELDIHAPLDGKSKTACAASLDLAWLRCGVPGGLRRLDLDETNRRHIDASAMFATGVERPRCLQCHIFDHPVSKPAPSPDALLGARSQYLDSVAGLVAALPPP